MILHVTPRKDTPKLSVIVAWRADGEVVLHDGVAYSSADWTPLTLSEADELWAVCGVESVSDTIHYLDHPQSGPKEDLDWHADVCASILVRYLQSRLN